MTQWKEIKHAAVGWQINSFKITTKMSKEPGQIVGASHCGGFSCCRPLALGHTGLFAPQHVGSSQVKDWTHVTWAGRQILYHWTTRDTLFCFLRFSLLLLLFVARFLDQENLERPGFESDAISKLHFVWSTLESLWVYLHIEKRLHQIFFTRIVDCKRLYYCLQIPASPFLEASLTSDLDLMTSFGQSK